MTRDDDHHTVKERPAHPLKWKALVGLVVLWIAAWTDAAWVFAILFIWWAVVDVYYGEAHFIERVPRENNPITFWLIIGSWVALSVLWIIYD